MRKYKFLAVALAAALTFGVSCSHNGKKADDAIVTGIKAAMFSEPALNAANIEVASQSGVVTLTGQVPDEAAHLAAFKIATQASGVSKVNDQLSVGNSQQALASTPPASEQPAVTPATPTPNKAKIKASAPKPAKQIENSESSAPPAADKPMSAPIPAVAAPPPPPQPVTVTIPANTIVSVRTIDGIDSSQNQTGQVFKASLDAPIVVDEKVIVPTGATAYLKLVSASSAGRMAGRSELTLALTNVVFQGKTYSVTSSDVKQSGASRGKRTAATIGGGAALGALIGAIAGGGKGAAIGALAGGGAGTAGAAYTGNKELVFPAETALSFKLKDSVALK